MRLIKRLFKNLKQVEGIGLLEMIIALGVIITGVIGGLTLAINNLISISTNDSRLVAANLAREAVEVIRNKRDSNWLNNALWYEGILQDPDNNYRLITFFEVGSNSWQFNDQTQDIENCDECRLYYHAGSGAISHDPSADPEVSLTSYKRLVTLRQICWHEEIGSQTILSEGQKCEDDPDLEWIGWQVNTEVRWQGAGRTHRVELEDHLYNWR
ncbi:hypothetical protein KKF32_03270 [Patescibacteria group bacterium]|nr:hypothetical protein [Patescibacteria group bacterium]